MSEAIDKCVDMLVAHKKKENDALVEAFERIYKRIAFLEGELEAMKRKIAYLEMKSMF